MKKEALIRRKTRVRSKIGHDVYRLSVFRSNKYLFAQIIETKTGKTILGLSEKKVLTEEESKGITKVEKAKNFGEKFGKAVLEKKIKEIVFDRGQYKYHGRVQAFADGARKSGLIF